MPALQFLKFMKSALGMPAMPPVPSRTTLVKFFKLDVDFGFFIFSKLDPYKTPAKERLKRLSFEKYSAFACLFEDFRLF